jgi:hypothetical protein
MPPAPPAQWGDAGIVRQRLGDAVKDLVFERDVMITPTLSPRHSRVALEATLGPLIGLVRSLAASPDRLAQLRAELDGLLAEIFADNHLRQSFLMTRATKR